MTIAIVTSRSFLLCDSINYMTLDSGFEYSLNDEIKAVKYTINISYNSTNRNNNHSSGLSGSRDTTHHVSISVFGEDRALKLFKELLNQVRDQCPDEPFLNSIVEKILTGEMEDVKDDTSSIKIYSPREEEGRSKAVL
jgi:hypothetical protein